MVKNKSENFENEVLSHPGKRDRRKCDKKLIEVELISQSQVKEVKIRLIFYYNNVFNTGKQLFAQILL